MKLTFLLMFFCLMQVSATSYSQTTKFTFKAENKQIVDVLREIEVNSKFRFFYLREQVDVERRVSITANDATVEQILDELFKGRGIDYELMNDFLIVLSKSHNKLSDSGTRTFSDFQQRTVTGIVTDVTGQPLPGVSVIIKGTTQGTITNTDGEYTLINFPEDAILVFSFVGMRTKEEFVRNQTNINIILEEDLIGIEEVIAVGYRTVEKGRLTGSVSTLSGEEIDKIPMMDLERSLQGKLPGLKISDRGGRPGKTNMEVFIRGKSTLGNNNPLVVVDGIPQESLPNIAPQDIESISVLKDASAAIYGARAANGVILIQTKVGKIGAPEITINSNYGISKYTRLPKLMNSYQNATYLTEVEERYGRARSYSDDDIQKFQSGEYPLTHPNTDWYNEIFDDYAPQNHQNISLRGGSDRIQYYIGGDYFTKDYMYKGNDKYYDSYQARSKIDVQVIKQLKIGFHIDGNIEKIHDSAQPDSYIFHLAQMTKPQLVSFYPNGFPGYGVVGGNVAVLITDKAGWMESKRNNFNSKFLFDLDMDWITQGLALQGYAFFNHSFNHDEDFRKTWPVYKYDAVNDEYLEFVGANSEGARFSSLQETRYFYRTNMYNLQLNYVRTFNDHNINAFIAYEQSEGLTEMLQGYRRDLISLNKPELFVGSEAQQKTYGYSDESGRVNYFGSISYDYKRKYLFDFTLRHDGSFNFPEQGKFGTFPGISLGWVISEEQFMTQNWIDNLKIKASYAEMGNDRVSSFQYLSQYAISGYSAARGWFFGEGDGSLVNAIYLSNIPNPNITWEVAKIKNIGLEASLWNRLSFNFDYFYEKRRGILITRSESVPAYTGLTLPNENLGKVNNSGVEFSFNYRKPQTYGLNYNIGGNLQFSRNKIVYMDEAPNIPDYRKKEGHPMDSWVVYLTDGIFKTQDEVDNTQAKLNGTKPGDIKYIDYNSDGKIDGNDQVRLYSSRIPELQFGLNFGLLYKGFEFDIFFQGQAFADTYIAHDRGSDDALPEYFFIKRWTEDNRNADYPRAYQRNDTYNYNLTSDFWLYDASFIRIKDIILAYNLPTQFLSGSFLKGIRIYINGSNLLTLDKLKNRMGGNYYDPETNNNQGKYYPQETIITAGVNIKL